VLIANSGTRDAKVLVAKRAPETIKPE
jgi:hypothetical protein